MRKDRKSQAGFSMIELLVATVILSVALLGLAQLQITAMQQNSKNEQIMAAVSLAQMVVEDVMNRERTDNLFRVDSDGEDNWSAAAPMPTNPPVFETAVPGAGTFRVTYETVTAYEGIDNLCLFTVYVRSTSRLFGVGSQTNPVTMTTIKRFTPAS